MERVWHGKQALSADESRQVTDDVEDRGYAVIPGVLTATEADDVRELLMALADADRREVEKPRLLQRVVRLAARDAVFRDLMCHPIPVAFWRSFLGQDMVCSTWSGIILHPGFGSTPWHVDYPYWSMQAPYITDNLTGQSVWLLDDFTEANGGTGVIPGSHRRPMPPPYADDEWPAEAEVITGSKGSLVLANGAWWHSSRPNTTARPRAGLLGMYIRSCCITQEPMREQLAEIENPSDDVTQLLCGNQYQSRNIRYTA